MMIVLVISLHFGLLFSLARWGYKKWNKENSKFYWSALLFKLCMAISVGIIYGNYYGGEDTWAYFKDAEKLADLARSNFFTYVKAMLDSDANMGLYQVIGNQEWRSVFFVKVVSVFALFTKNNYWLSAAWFSILSFFCCWNIYKVFCRWKPKATLASAMAFLFFPSLAFWSSGIQKEALALCGLFILVTGLISYWDNQKINAIHWVLILVSLFTVWKLRYFWLGAFLLTSIPLVVLMFLKKKQVSGYRIFLFTLSAASAACVFIFFLHPNFSPDIFLEIVVQNYRQFVVVSDPEKMIHFHQLTADWVSIFLNAPWAFFSGLFRPFMWEATNSMSFLASLENTFLLLMTLFAIPKFFKALQSKDAIIFAAALFYILVLCTFLALSTPNFGSLSRYRVGFLPFFVFIITFQNPLLHRLQEFFHSKVPQ